MMPERVLITGISGFTGSYLREVLSARGFSVFGISNRPATHPDDRMVDLLDVPELEKCVNDIRPDYVIHLAAISFVGHGRPEDFYRVNQFGTLNLLEVLAAGGPTRKVIVASSANVYGRPDRLPVEESACPAPVNHYGISKLGMEMIVRTWADQLPILIVRPFNYTGVGQSPSFVVAKAVQHFAERKPEIEMGDLDVVREFNDVRDVARIYAALLEHPSASGVVNICSGIGHRLGDVLDALRKLTGLAPKVRQNESLKRGIEIPELVGSTDRLRALISKVPTRPLVETLQWMLDSYSSSSRRAEGR